MRFKLCEKKKERKERGKTFNFKQLNNNHTLIHTCFLVFSLKIHYLFFFLSAPKDTAQNFKMSHETSFVAEDVGQCQGKRGKIKNSETFIHSINPKGLLKSVARPQELDTQADGSEPV